MSVKKEQLEMEIKMQDFELLQKEIQLPEGYLLTRFHEGLEDSWANLLNSSSFDSEWNVNRIKDYFTCEYRRNGSAAVISNERVISATFASIHPALCSPDPCRVADLSKENNVHTGIFDYVATHPEYRGKGLSKVVCISILDYFFTEMCYKRVVLNTDDWRLPAISLYFSLGFKPIINSDPVSIRWKKIHKDLERTKK